MFKNKRLIGVILAIFLLVFNISGLAYYKYTQESGANFYVNTDDKVDALEDTNEIRQIVDDLGNLLEHLKRDDLYPKDKTTGGTIQIPEAGLKYSNDPVDGDIATYSGTDMTWQSLAELNLMIGAELQAWDAQLTDIAGLTPTDNYFIVRDGNNFVTESGSTARSSLGIDLSLYYLKTAIDSQAKMEAIWEVSLATDSELHNELTLGTANGLYLSVQELSLAINSSNSAGAVASGSRQNSKVWKTDAGGVLGGRTDEGGAGATDFRGMADTPASYAGQAGKYRKVNVGETALESSAPYSNIVKCADYDHPDDAITAIGASNKTLLVTEAEICDTNFTIPANVLVKFERGGKWTINNGITVTFNGQITAGLWQIFEYIGTGTLAGVPLVKEVYPQWWGAIGDNSNDDTSAIENALNMQSTVVLLSGRTYKTTSNITIYGNVSLKSSGAIPAVIAPSGDFTTFTFKATSVAIASTTVSAEMEIGDKSVTLSSTANISVGDLLVFTSDVLWYWDNRDSLYKGELHTVKSIAGDVVTLTSPVADNYDITGVETVTVSVFPRKSVYIENIRIEANPHIRSDIIDIYYMQDSYIEGLELINSDGAGLSLNACYNTLVNKASINLNADTSVGLGYGIQDRGGMFTKITHSNFTNCRRGVDFSGRIPSRFGEVSNSTVSHEDSFDLETSGFGTHGTAEHILFANNIISGTRVGILVRGGNISIIGNTFSGKGQQCILASFGNNLYIGGNFVSSAANRIRLNQGLGHSSWKEFLYIGIDFDAGGKITVFGNNAFQLRGQFIYTSQPDIDWHIENNSVVIKNNASSTNVYFLANEANLSNSRICGNRYEVIAGIKNWYDTNTTISENKTDIDYWSMTDTSKLEVWSGAGSLANVSVNLLYNLNGGDVEIRGDIRFDVITDTVKLRLNNMPSPLFSSQTFLAQTASFTMISLHFLATGNELYISGDNTAHDKAWAVGTGYIVPINITYRR